MLVIMMWLIVVYYVNCALWNVVFSLWW